MHLYEPSSEILGRSRIASLGGCIGSSALSQVHLNQEYGIVYKPLSLLGSPHLRQLSTNRNLNVVINRSEQGTFVLRVEDKSFLIPQKTVEQEYEPHQTMFRIYRFLNEAFITHKLYSRGCQTTPYRDIHFQIDDEGNLAGVLSYEHIDGEDLSGTIARSASPLLLIGQQIKQLSDIVDGVHKEGVIIRDIKPENVIVGHNGLRKIDFGIGIPTESEFYDGSNLPWYTQDIATLLKEEHEKMKHYFCSSGTLAYMAPETFKRKYSFQSDYFSLASTIVE